MGMGLRNQNVKGGERQRLINDANLVAKTEQRNARAAYELGLYDAIDRAVVDEAETLVDRRGSDQRDLAILYPIAAALIKLVRWITNWPAQRRAGDLLIAQCLDARFVAHEQARGYLIERVGEEESLAAKLGALVEHKVVIAIRASPGKSDIESPREEQRVEVRSPVVHP